MVDTVLYFEGERGHQFRILRAVKNRFGATDEIGVFEMSDRGLVEVPNPSALFLGGRQGAGRSARRRGRRAGAAEPVSGAAVFAGIEGTRPVLVEVQALVAPALLGTPRRAVVGWDGTRLAMITAVLDARCGLSVGANDIYLNIAGGLRIAEPAADLAVAAALVSALSETPVPADTVVFGEIALSGEVRPVGHSEARLKEAAKLGFAEAWMPAAAERREAAGGPGWRPSAIGHLSDLVARLSPKRGARPAAASRIGGRRRERPRSRRSRGHRAFGGVRLRPRLRARGVVDRRLGRGRADHALRVQLCLRHRRAVRDDAAARRSRRRRRAVSGRR